MDQRPKRQWHRGGFGALGVGVSVLLLAPLFGCASGGSASEDPELDALTHVPDTVWVAVRNQYRLDVNIYAFFGGGRQFLGIVTTNNDAEFTVRGGLAESTRFRIAADPIGSTGTYTTDEILVRKGDLVEVTIQDPLPQSYYSVR